MMKDIYGRSVRSISAAVTDAGGEARSAVDAASGARRRGALHTKEAILSAACALFGRVGYSAASTREIAAMAGTDPVLIRRYFGSKEALFRQALESSFDMNAILEGVRSSVGERVASLFIEPGGLPLSLSIIILSSGEAESRRISQELLKKRVIDPVRLWIGEETDSTALKLIMLWTGYFIARDLILPDRDFDAKVRELSTEIGRQSQMLIDRYDRSAPSRSTKGLPSVS